MSDTSRNTAALQQSLADPELDPAGLFALVMSHYTDPAAAEVLCKHAEGSLPSLVMVYAVQQQIRLIHELVVDMKTSRPGTALLEPIETTETWLASEALHDNVVSLAGAVFAHADEDDLLESFRTVCDWLPGGADHPVAMKVLRLFAYHAPLEALTDRVTDEMRGSP